MRRGAQTTSTIAAAVEEQGAAAGEIARNIQAVASAAERLAASANEIGRQVQQSSRIAEDAVRRPWKTDTRIAELPLAAGRIAVNCRRVVNRPSSTTSDSASRQPMSKELFLD